MRELDIILFIEVFVAKELKGFLHQSHLLMMYFHKEVWPQYQKNNIY